MTGDFDDAAEAASDAVVVEVVYAHPIERVWRALTDPKALGTWLMPNDFAPRVGHRFTFRTEPGQEWNGTVECEVTRVVEPTTLAYTWQGGNLPVTLVTYTLAAVTGGTRLRLVHSGFAAGGAAALRVRDLLSQGWASKVLREKLPALLERLARDE